MSVVQECSGQMSAARPVAVADGHVRAIVNLTRAIETAVSRHDTISAMLALATLRDVLTRHFAREEQAMSTLSGFDQARHAHEHRALLSGLGAIHCAILAESLTRLSDQVAAYVNRAARHAIEHDVPLSENLAAA
jgi:hemerythrin